MVPGHGMADRANIFGASGWTPVVGDWNPDVKGTKIGIYKDGSGILTGTGTVRGIPVRIKHSVRSSGWIPIIGKWN